MRAFWWRQAGGALRNFGDELAPLLLARFAGVTPEWSPAARSDVVAVGSIATMLPAQYTGAVLGIGTARETPIDLSRADVRALRGPLTARCAGITHPVALGDPGLLVCDLATPNPVHPLGVVAHWQDKSLRHTFPDALHIDVRADPLEVIAAIASCARIVSSSLHGLIVADAFGLPRQWAWFDKVQGNGWKFSDYMTVVGEDTGPGVWAYANPRLVRQAQSDLREVYATWGAEQ